MQHGRRKKAGEQVFLRYGAPALAFMVVGSVGLARFVKGRNEVADKRSSSYSEQEYEELRRQQQDQWRKQQEEPFDLEAAYEVPSSLSCSPPHPIFPPAPLTKNIPSLFLLHSLAGCWLPAAVGRGMRACACRV
jgi:hypothetical protein